MVDNERGKLRVSVVVPSRNSEKTIKGCLDSLIRQTYKEFEIIVVDASSNDGTLDIVSSYPVKIIVQEKGNLAHARNIGLAASTGDIVAFLDSDAMAPPDWLLAVANRFRTSNLAVVGGPDYAPANSNTWARACSFVDSHIVPMVYRWGPVESITGCNVAYKKENLERVGGFNEELDSAEETDVNRRIRNQGAQILFDPQTSVIHQPRRSPSQYFKQNFLYGVGKGQMLRHDPKNIKPSNFAALILLLAHFVVAWFFLTARPLAFSMILPIGLALVTSILFYSIVKNRNVELAFPVLLAALIWFYAQSVGQLIGLLGYSGRHA